MQNDTFNRPSSASKNPRLLIVEDSLTLQSLYHYIFKQCGYEIDLAPTGQAAIDQATQNPYLAMILDDTLPDMTSEDVLIAIRAHEHSTGQHLPILIHSAEADPERFQRYREKGADMTCEKHYEYPPFQAILPQLIAFNQQEAG